MGYWGKRVDPQGSTNLQFFVLLPWTRGVAALGVVFYVMGLLAFTAEPSPAAPGPGPSANLVTYDYTPERFSVPYPPSVIIAQSWRKHIEFIYNRGPQATPFLAKILEILDPRQIKRLPQFKNPQSTRITLMTYEFRSREMRQHVEELLKQGFQVRIVVDAGPVTPLQKPTARQWNRWTDKQKASYLAAYDHDRDGTVSDTDIAFANTEKWLTIETWKKLQSLKSNFDQQLELITSPYDVVPASDQYRYPRLHHFKKYSVDLLQDDGTWASEVSIISSANLTDSCLNKRIYQGAKNQSRYLEGEPYSLAKGSEGHIQFGAVIRGAAVNKVLDAVPEKWIDAYKKGRHFDSLALPAKLNPRLVFQDKKTGHQAVLQAFYSEGMTGALHRESTRDPVDPINAITNILSQEGLRLKVYYSDQFVFAHTGLARHLRHQFARGGLEDLGLFIDGNFAVETYSTLPQALFAPIVNNRLAVLDGKAVQEMLPLPTESEWEKNVFVFEGDRGVYGGPGDKLHAKHQYLEYTLEGYEQRHYTTAWGSGNQSNNAGQQNADALFILDTTDPALGNAIRPYVVALRDEPRMRPFAEAYLERRFLEIFNQTRTDVFTETFYREFSEFLKTSPKQTSQQWRTDLKKLLSKLKKAGPSLLNNTSTANGQNFLQVLEWYVNKSRRPLDWVEFYLCIELALPSTHPQPGLINDLQSRWLGSTPNMSALRDFQSMAESLFRSGSSISLPQDESYRAVMNHLCEGYLSRLNISIPGFQLRRISK